MARKGPKPPVDDQLGFALGPAFGFGMAPVLPLKKTHPEPLMPEVAADPKIPGSAAPKEDSASRIEDPAILSVGEVTRRITRLLEEGMGEVWVEGEISNLRRQVSGHSYFTLKDEESQLSCVLFARTASALRGIMLRDGLQVQLFGQISVYQPRGQYQMMVRLVQPKGEGALQARFEELKQRLAAEGLFASQRKRPLPRFPGRIGVVTSPTGAAIRDFLQILHRRHPGLHVVISPVRVQGKGAAVEIAAAIEELSSGVGSIGPVDVIVVTRGGGSLEDLWEFNEEVVARAIAASAVPVVSAVGHEIDFSIADFTADLRAPTPSAAAELLAADGGELMERCHQLVGGIGRAALSALERQRGMQRLLASSALFREPHRRLEEARQTGDRLQEALDEMLDRRMERLASSLSTASARIMGCHPGQRLLGVRHGIGMMGERLVGQLRRRIDREKGRLAGMESAFAALDPKATLARGFSITRNTEGRVLTSPAHAKPGERILTQLAGGEIVSSVEVEKPER